jgi:hypothetical protein
MVGLLLWFVLVLLVFLGLMGPGGSFRGHSRR